MNDLAKIKVLIGVTIDVQVNFHKKLAESLYARGHEVHIVSSDGPNLSKLTKGIVTHPLNMARNPSPVKDVVALFKWVMLLAKVKPTLVMAGTPKSAMLAMLAAKLLRVPVRIYFVHGLRMENTQGFWGKVLLALEKITSYCASSVVAVSPSLGEVLIKLNISSPHKVKVIAGGSTQGVNLEKFRPASSLEEKNSVIRSLSLSPNKPIVGFVGRLTRDKGVAEFGEAICRLVAAGVPLQTLIVGQVEDEQGIALISSLKSAEIPVATVGYVEDVSPYFHAMDVFCLPSYREGLGNVILEAFASKIPVVATNVTGIIDLVEDGVTGLLVPPRDSAALASAIQALLKDKDLADQISLESFNKVSKSFEESTVIKNQINFLEGLIERTSE